MRARKCAKQLKRMFASAEECATQFSEDVDVAYGYTPRQEKRCYDYLVRITRKNYFGLIRKKIREYQKTKDSWMWHKLYIHNASSPYIFDDIADYWKFNV